MSFLLVRRLIVIDSFAQAELLHWFSFIVNEALLDIFRRLIV